MKTFELSGVARTETGKKVAKKSRKNGLIPAVIYGGKENFHFSVEQRDIDKLIFSPEVFVVDLSIAGKSCKAVVKDVQFHPVKDTILHIDFLEVSEANPIIMAIPVVLQGLAEGVKAGGKLSLEKRKLKVKAVYSNIPENLTVDVTSLGLGKSLQVGELSFDNLELMDAKNAVVCGVRLTRAARGAAAAAAKG